MVGGKASQRTVLGIPVSWNRQNPFKTLWNPEDDRLFPPKSFGIGWTINFHSALRRLGVIKKSPNRRGRKKKSTPRKKPVA